MLHGSDLLQVEVLSKEGFLEVVWKRWRKVAWWGEGSRGGLSSGSKPAALKRWSPLHLQPLQALHPLLQGAQLHQRLHLCQSLGRNWFPVQKPARKVQLTGPRTAHQGEGGHRMWKKPDLPPFNKIRPTSRLAIGGVVKFTTHAKGCT